MSRSVAKLNRNQVHPAGISILVPVFNEEAVIRIFYERLVQALHPVADDVAEILFVDDGSTDASARVLSQLQSLDAKVAVLSLTRNFGKEVAMSAGLDYAIGEAVVLIDADLQDPPELIPGMLGLWQQGFDVVYAQRRSRDGDGFFKQLTARGFYRVFNRLARIEIPDNAGDFRLLSRRAVLALQSMPERTRFMKGLFSWIGFRQTCVQFDRPERAAGTTKWNFRSLFSFAIEGIVSFSPAPLKLASYAGALAALAALAFAAFVVLKTLVLGNPVPGYPSMMAVVLFLGGIQLLAIGILGEYVSRIFIETKSRPLYLIDEYAPSKRDAATLLRQRIGR